MRLLALLCMILFSSSNAFAASDGKYKIGLLAPLTGSYASEGQDMKKVLLLLAEEINNKGGINNTPIEIIVEDDGSSPRTAVNAANRLVDQRVTEVIGTYGSAVTEATQDIFDEAEVLQVTTGSSAINLTQKGLPYFFRTSPSDNQQARVAVKELEKQGCKNIAIIHDNTAFAKGLADETKKILNDKKDSINIVLFDAIQPKERDYSTILTKLKGLNPDVIFFTGYYPEAGLFLRQTKEMNWNVPMLGGDGTNNIDIIKIAGKDAAKGYRFISPPIPQDLTNPEAKEFLEAYHAKYGEYPHSIWSLIAGDALKVIVDAAANSKSTKEASNYLHNLPKPIKGLTGDILFDANGDRVDDVYRVYIVNEDGAFTIAN